MHGYIKRSVTFWAAPLLLAGVAGAVTPVTMSAARAVLAGTTVPFRISGSLSGVAATSASSAWAVGCSKCDSGLDETQILGWNGTTWTPALAPAPVEGHFLYSVAGSSASNAWAVGQAASPTGPIKTLILHWNGTAWK